MFVLRAYIIRSIASTYYPDEDDRFFLQKSVNNKKKQKQNKRRRKGFSICKATAGSWLTSQSGVKVKDLKLNVYTFVWADVCVFERGKCWLSSIQLPCLNTLESNDFQKIYHQKKKSFMSVSPREHFIYNNCCDCIRVVATDIKGTLHPRWNFSLGIFVVLKRKHGRNR